MVTRLVARLGITGGEAVLAFVIGGAMGATQAYLYDRRIAEDAAERGATKALKNNRRKSKSKKRRRD